MGELHVSGIRSTLLLALLLTLQACGGGGGGSSDTSGESGGAQATAEATNGVETGGTLNTGNEEVPEESPKNPFPSGAGNQAPAIEVIGNTDSIPDEPEGPNAEDPTAVAPFEPVSDTEAARFLSQATFGPNSDGISEVAAMGPEAWMLAEFQKPATLHLEKVLSQLPADGIFVGSDGRPLPELKYLTSDSFWEAAIEADDQLRQRMAYALSQILVVSPENNFGRAPQMMAQYMDLLTRGALGNYRELLEQVTYSTAMGNYLTYLGNRKANPVKGSLPDENYAREILQLFTIGLVELNQDGTPKLDQDGYSIELYDNQDIQELAKVFTGLSYRDADFNAGLATLSLSSTLSPMGVFDKYHSTLAKQFLNTNIPANTDGEQSIQMALDGIFSHPNVGPFISRQLIQRFTTSAPSPAYVQRVSTAFDSGIFNLSSGNAVGTGRRGDLKATLAAILLDAEARSTEARSRNTFGKLREPVLRFTHWARAFKINNADSSNIIELRYAGQSRALGQHPYRAPTVFNFYRPGYIAPTTHTGAANLNAPELQITDASSILGYTKFMTKFVFGRFKTADASPPDSFLGDYSDQAALPSDTEALINNLDLLLTHGTLREETRQRITKLLALNDAVTRDDLIYRTQLACLMIMTSPEYLVLR